MNAQERLDYLLEVIAVPSNRGRLTHTWVAENLGLPVADGVYAAINAQSVPTALRYVTGDGIDTTATLWKQQATAVAQAIESLAPYLVTLRDFESIYKPRWQTLGYEIEPTLQQAQVEVDTAAKIAIRETVVAGLQSKLNAIDSWLKKTEVLALSVEGFQAYADSLLASEDGNPAGSE